MLTSLLQVIGLVEKPIKKQDVLKTLDNTWSAIGEDLLPALDSIIKNKDIKKIANDKYLKGVLQACNIKTANNIDGLSKIKETFVIIHGAYKDLKSTISKYLSEYLSDTSLTARDAAIVRILTDCHSMTAYLLDLLYYVCITDNETDLSKKKIEEIKKGVGSFSNLYKKYSTDFNKLVKELKEVSTHVIVDKDKTSIIGVLLNQTGKELSLPVDANFINNPVYHIRMWWIDREIRKYESLKLRKQMVELKIMELKARQNHENHDKITKQLEYYEEKLSSVEYDIRKIENN